MPSAPLPHEQLPHEQLPHEQLPNNSPLTVLVDDVRDFKDQRPALVARSSPEALNLLDKLEGERIDHLWLDHDLTGEDTIAPVVDLLVHRARTGTPLDVGQIHIHTANIGAGLKMDLVLRAAGYPVVRSYTLTMWTRWF
jgi:hypothetical protein